MNTYDEQFQEQLARLEAGEPLALAGADLPEEEAAVLALAAELKAVELPEPDEAAVLHHRAAAVRTAQRVASSQAAASSFKMPWWLAALLAWWREHQVIAWGATAIAAALLILFVGNLLNEEMNSTATVAEEADDNREAETDDGNGISLFERWFGGDDAGDNDGEVVSGETPSDSSENPDLAALPEEELEYQTFLPILTEPLQTGPNTAVLGDLHGLVSVQKPDGSWEQVSYLSSVAAGSRVRTGALSGASLTFFDGSVAKIGPDSELSIDTLNALPPEEGFRTVVLTQWQGNSTHDVEFRNDNGSQYEVKSPSGTGIARGTIFEVVVLPNLTSRYTVLEGRVDVININVTVSVLAGQLSTIPAASPPTPPVFQVSGEGEVTQVGESWVIGGQTFATNDRTIIVGNPQVGDWVTVQGHLLDDGSKVADQIVLVRELPEDLFTLTAVVTEISAEQWLLGDVVILLDEETAVDPDIELDDWVRVSGVVQPDGTLLARRIQKQTADSYPFEFVGVVQTIGEESWLISGIEVDVNDRTEIDDDLAEGDVVKVEGQILSDGVWLAREIQARDDEDDDDDDDENAATFEFTGLVETIDPWVVAGIELVVDEWTEIDTAVAPGDMVKVEGVILADGSWLAEEISLLDDDEDDNDEDDNIEIILRFTGVVESTDPWIINGITLIVTDDSLLDEAITVGTLVQVTARLAEDGSWEIVWLRPLLPPTTGCFTVHTRITTVNGSQISLTNWPSVTLDDDVSVEGNLVPNSTIALTICLGDDDTVVVVNIIVIQVVITPAPPGDNAGGGNGRVTICHNGNTITISQSGLNGHLNHGDTLGPCSQGGGGGGDHDDDDDDDDDD